VLCPLIHRLLVVACLGAMLPNTLHAAAYVVTSVSDFGNGVCTAAGVGDGCTLREAIATANGVAGDDVIIFAPSVAGTIQLSSVLPVLSSNIDIVGPGRDVVTVRRDSGGDYRIFTISNGTATGPRVSISGLTLTNGLANGGSPDGYGGAILNDRSSTVSIRDCRLSGNTATTATTGGKGGAISINAGGMPGSASLVVRRCIFSDNLATSSNLADSSTGVGGAIYSERPEESITLDESLLSGNSATNDGGAIKMGAHVEIYSSTFRENSARNGGAISNGSGFLMLVASTFYHNSALSNGGALYNSASGFFIPNASVTSCTFDGNSASSGGAIVNNGATSLFSLGVRNTIFRAGTSGANLVNAPGAMFTSDGYNLSDDNGSGLLNQASDQLLIDARLDPAGPQDHGGRTPVIGLEQGSPALDKGKAFTYPFDQRRFARPYDISTISPASGGDNSDIGAFESYGQPPIPELRAAVSRKTHGTAGTFDVDLLSGNPYRTESRSGGAGGNFQLVATFASAVTLSAASVTSSNGQATATASANGTVVTIDLASVADAQRVAVTLENVSDGRRSGDITLPLEVLAGDVVGQRAIDSVDVIEVKRSSGQPASAANFRADVNVGGVVNASDIGLVKSRLGTRLP
jgi:CSLREA domain-containing protein